MQSTSLEKKPAKSTDSFKQIYAIAKESKVNKEEAAKKLQKLLEDYEVEASKKSPIWVPPLEQQDNNKLTPAGKLAFEGDEEAAEFLRIFGADAGAIASGAARGRYREYAEYLRLNYCTGPLDTLFIAMGAAKGGYQDYAEELRLNNDIGGADALTPSAVEGDHLEYAEYLLSKHGANVDIIAYAASALGYRDYTEYLRTDCNADIKTIVMGASGGGYIAYAEYLYRKKCYRDIVAIADRISSCQRIMNEQEVLRSLAENDEFRLALDTELKKKKSPFPTLNQLINKAQKIATQKPKYNFDQCVALGKPELSIWYLQCLSLVKDNKLSFGIFISIGCYLSPMTYKDSQGLCTNLRFDMFQKLLVKDANKYCVSKRWFGLFGGDEQADAFSVACANAKNTEQLKPLLEKEMKQDNKDAKAQPQDNQLRDLVTRHYKRFN